MVSSVNFPPALNALYNIPVPNKDFLSFMFENVSRYDQDAPIFINAMNSGKEFLTINSTRKLVRQLIKGLRNAGLKAGESVVIQAGNSIYYVPFCYAIIGAGGIFSPANPALRLSEMVHHYKLAKPRFVICGQEILPVVREATAQVGIPASNIIVFEERPLAAPSTTTYWTDLLSTGEDDWVSFDNEHVATTTIAAMYPTSGTSGNPKLAMVSHRNLVASGTLVHDTHMKSFQTRQMIVFPMFHVSATVFALISPIRQGWPTFIMSRFDPVTFINMIYKHQITDVGMVPAMMNAVLQSGLATTASLASLRDGGVGAAPVSPEMLGVWQKLMHPVCCFSGKYGLTETTGIVTQTMWPENDTEGSIGRLIPGLTAKIIDESGNIVTTHDTPGELYIRGPTMFSGYRENPKATTEAFDEEGYFITGDVVTCNASGKLFVVDRKKELIKVRGFQVSPAEIEGVLLGHPSIADAAVIGVPHLDGEMPRAYVVAKEHSKVGKDLESDIKRLVAERLSSYKKLEGGVVFMKALPRNSTGKLLRRVLRDSLKQETKQSSKL